MSFPRYPACKDSGVEWLGEVPAHWALPKLKQVATFLGGGTPSRENLDYWSGDIPWVSPKDMKTERLTGAEESITANGLANSSTSLVPPDRLLMVVRSGILKHTIPVAINSVEVALNQDMKALDFGDKSAASSFFLRWVQGLNDLLLLAWTKEGATVESLEHEYVANTIVPMPPHEELAAIATFLDHETAKIDALVAEQERLIELLKEKRQAVISHSVTKGLDPSVPMKDSGMEWLGEVPAHWEVRKISHSFRAKKGSNAAELTKEFCATIEGNYPVYSGQTENSGVMASISSYEFDANEAGVLFSTTVGAKAMTIMHITGRFSLSQNCMIIAPTVDLHVRFFYYHMQPLFQYERGLIPEHMQASFRMEDLYAYRIAMPTANEQRSIAKYLDERCAIFDALINEARKNVALLQERRTALISAAVTGQIDVRGWVPAETAT